MSDGPGRPPRWLCIGGTAPMWLWQLGIVQDERPESFENILETSVWNPSSLS